MTTGHFKHTPQELSALQALPLSRKIAITQTRLLEFCQKTPAYLSFSGGKDSLVLFVILSQMAGAGLIEMPPAVYIDTFYQYPAEREWVKKQPGVVILKGNETPKAIIEKFGYPVITKEVSERIEEIRTAKTAAQKQKYIKACTYNRSFALPQKYLFLVDAPFKISGKCCQKLKKEVGDKYQKKTGRARITGMTAEESRLRQKSWLAYGCNSFNGKKRSMPLAFWTAQNVLEFLHAEGVTLPPDYGEIVKKQGKWTTSGIKRNGCSFCLFGAHCKNDGRFFYLKEHYPKMYDFCLEKLGFQSVIDWVQRNSAFRYDLPDYRCSRCLPLGEGF